MAKAQTSDMPTPATIISRKCGSIPIALQTANPPAATAAIVIAIHPALFISTLLLKRLFDHQIHAGCQTQHRSDHNPPGRPAIPLVQPPPDETSEANSHSNLQSDARQRTPIGVLILRHLDSDWWVCAFLHKLRSSPTPASQPGGGPKE